MAHSTDEHYLMVHGEKTYVTKCGGKPSNVLVLIIPGNPGSAAYYDEFAQVLYEASGQRIPVWAVSHAGHVTLPKQHQQYSEKKDFYSLQGQIDHKFHFIEEHVPANVKLILIGHSIGCYIILHMLDEIGDRVLKCAMLFLTIERLAASPKGRIITPILKYLRWAAPLLIYPVTWLPEWLQTWLLEWYFKSRQIHPCSIKATKQLVSSSSCRNFTNMAHEEFQTVNTADYHLIEKYLENIWFYYGSKDHYCPFEYYDDMRKQYPEADITLCEGGFEHAFCLESSREMAKIVWKYLEEKVPEVK